MFPDGGCRNYSNMKLYHTVFCEKDVLFEGEVACNQILYRLTQGGNTESALKRHISISFDIFYVKLG